MAHRTARLNGFGRQLLIDRVVGDGWTVATAARAQGISRATGYKWVRRYRLEGSAGLADRSSRPHRSPNATPAPDVQRIVAARLEWRWGPDRLGPLLGLPVSTVAAVIRRAGLPRLADIDHPTGLPVRRYEVCHPGALVHQDHKKLGRIPDGGGRRVIDVGPTRDSPITPDLGDDRFEVIVDDRSRRSGRSCRSPSDSRRQCGDDALDVTAPASRSLPKRSWSSELLVDHGRPYRSNAGIGRTHSYPSRPPHALDPGRGRPPTNGIADHALHRHARSPVSH